MQSETIQNNERYERGLRKMAELDAKAGQEVIDTLNSIAPDFARFVIEYPFGDIFSRPGLDLKTRELITVAALTALGAMPQLRFHLRSALNAGCTRDEIVETLMQMSVYAGFPAALNGLYAAKEIFAAQPE
jgi:4-carboxymuconolactone decarboxylase